MDCFKIYTDGHYPKKKKLLLRAKFPTRQKARQYCRNRPWDKWTIVHPDGTEEKFVHNVH